MLLLSLLQYFVEGKCLLIESLLVLLCLSLEGLLVCNLLLDPLLLLLLLQLHALILHY